MLIHKGAKSSYRNWYQQNKQRIAAKRKKLYAENPEYRQRAVEDSRRRRSGEQTPPVSPVLPDAPISFAQAADRLGIGTSTLREWRRKKYFPEPKRYNRALWVTENQVSLLKELKAFFQKYRMRPRTIKEDRLKEVRAFISANWN